MTIADRWSRCREEIDDAANEYGRRSSEIQVMAVSKTRSVQEIKAAQAAGLTGFGENRVNEAMEKFAELNAETYPLYLIGHLQGNKVQKINLRFTGVHSVDSLALAKKLSRHREQLRTPLEILLQVNTSGEESKTGFHDRGAFIAAAAEIAALPYLKLRGLMTMAPFVDDEAIVRRCFSRCREWSEHIADEIEGSPILSMGMSSDFRWAIAEGSSLLRIGTIVFGSR